MKNRTIKVVCPDCHGSGAVENYDSDGCPYDSGCMTCGGRGIKGSPFRDTAFYQGKGYLLVNFVETGNSCTACGGRGKWSGNTEHSGYVKKGGEFVRYKETRSETHACKSCLQTGMELKEILRKDCLDCRGRGKRKAWEKETAFLFFQTGREIEVEKSCGTCAGSGTVPEVDTKPLSWKYDVP